jgi:hypothetical protein
VRTDELNSNGNRKLPVAGRVSTNVVSLEVSGPRIKAGGRDNIVQMILSAKDRL